MLRVTNLTKRLPNGKVLLNGITFTVEKGEFVGILGASGAGKSLTMRCIVGLTTVTDGEVVFSGESGKTYRTTTIQGKELRRARRNIGVIFQGFHLVKRLTLGVVATFVLGYLSGYFAKQNITSGLTILVLIWIVIMGWVLWDVAEWYYDRFILTNKRVMLIEGIISRRVAMMPLARVTDMKYTQSALGRVLGYGTFELESAGQEQALRNVPNLPNPTDLYLQVVEEMYEPEASEARRRPAKIDDGGS